MERLKELAKELSKPFDPKEVGLKVQATNRDRTQGLVVSYIDARSVLDRLDEVVGPDGWQDAYEVLADRMVGDTRIVEVRCRLTVLGVTKEDVGEGDTLKAAFSDALKRAAVKFGIGRYLYSLPKTWAALDSKGNIADPERVKAQLFGGKAGEDTPPFDPASSSEAQAPKSDDNLITPQQKKMIYALMHKVDEDFGKLFKDDQKAQIKAMMELALEREVDDPGTISKADASKVITYLQELAGAF